MSLTMSLQSIKFVEYNNDGNAIFVNNASCFEDWPKEFKVLNKTYKFKSLGFMEKWMIGEYTGVAEYEVINHDAQTKDVEINKPC